MIISLSWLKQYVDIPVDTPTFVRDLTMLGLNVERCTSMGPEDPNIVVGHVIECDRHPNADRLSVCRVDVGAEERLDIVCGAPNVAAGQKVPVALVGAKLPGGLKIRKSKIRGAVSRGMICSAVELGLGADASGIMVLDEDLSPGKRFVDVFGEADAVLEIEVTPNRPDQLSHVGVAREVAALYPGEVRVPAPRVEAPAEKPCFDIEIEDPSDCYRFTGRVVRGVRVGPSPAWLRTKLESLGLNSVNNIVDVTNYVMMEMGQPLHAYDLNALPGEMMGARRGRAGESIVALDGNEYKLDGRNLLITCDDRPVGVAGVIGGMDTRVAENTVDLLIESAAFCARTVRESRKELNVSTDASYRFERGSDRQLCDLASARACELILDVAGGEAGEFVDRFPAAWQKREVCIRKAYVRRLLGVGLGTEEIAALLTRLHFGVVRSDAESVTVEVPSYRGDIVEEVDLVEEVARLYGYDRIGQGWSFRATTWAAPEPFDEFGRWVSGFLCARGHNELLLTSFTNGSGADLAVFEDDDRRSRPVAVSNPLTTNQTHLRTTLLPATLDVIRRNIDRGTRDLGVFARGRVFLPPEGEKGGLPEEKFHLVLAMSKPGGQSFWNAPARPTGFFDVKREVEQLCAASGAALERMEFEFNAGSGAFAYASRGGRVIEGGIVPAPMTRDRGIEQPVWYAEIDLRGLYTLRDSKRAFRVPSEYPASRRDLSLVVPGEITWESVEKCLAKHGGRLLESVQVFDVYEGENLPEGCIAVGVRLGFRSDTETLTDAVVDGVVEKTVRKLESGLGVRLRT